MSYINNQKSAFYNGIKFVDISGDVNLPTDFETDRISNKGEVMCFNHLVGNVSTTYHWEVLYIYDIRTCYGHEKIEDCKVKSTTIFVVMRRINPKLGNETWKSINQIITRKEKIKRLLKID